MLGGLAGVNTAWVAGAVDDEAVRDGPAPLDDEGLAGVSVAARLGAAPNNEVPVELEDEVVAIAACELEEDEVSIPVFGR